MAETVLAGRRLAQELSGRRIQAVGQSGRSTGKVVEPDRSPALQREVEHGEFLARAQGLRRGGTGRNGSGLRRVGNSKLRRTGTVEEGQLIVAGHQPVHHQTAVDVPRNDAAWSGQAILAVIAALPFDRHQPVIGDCEAVIERGRDPIDFAVGLDGLKGVDGAAGGRQRQRITARCILIGDPGHAGVDRTGASASEAAAVQARGNLQIALCIVERDREIGVVRGSYRRGDRGAAQGVEAEPALLAYRHAAQIRCGIAIQRLRRGQWGQHDRRVSSGISLIVERKRILAGREEKRVVLP